MIDALCTSRDAFETYLSNDSNTQNLFRVADNTHMKTYKYWTYGGQNGGGHCQSNGEGSRSFDVFAVLVADAENNQNQSESGEEFYTEALGRGQFSVKFRHTQRVVKLRWCQTLHKWPTVEGNKFRMRSQITNWKLLHCRH